jgi:hypothetical protein
MIGARGLRGTLSEADVVGEERGGREEGEREKEKRWAGLSGEER